MAVHGTRRGESVSWDYEGLLQLLSSLARERSGLPLLRCYWYEATVDGRRTAEQDALADVPGIKLRIAKIRPGRREGVETEIHRDLTTLARNNAISDALVISAEEDLAQVIADVQDLGMRVTLVHIAVDGNWTISRALRQESDDIIEIGGDHLRPYVELIAGAEPAHTDEDGDLAAARPLANGHSTAGAASYQQVPAASGNHAPPAIYTAPVVAEYQRPALQLPRAATREAREPRDGARRPRTTRDARDDRSRDERPAPPAVNGEAPATGPPGHPRPPGHPLARTSRPPGHPGPARHLRRAGDQRADPAGPAGTGAAEPGRPRPRRRRDRQLLSRAGSGVRAWTAGHARGGTGGVRARRGSGPAWRLRVRSRPGLSRAAAALAFLAQRGESGPARADGRRRPFWGLRVHPDAGPARRPGPGIGPQRPLQRAAADR